MITNYIINKNIILKAILNNKTKLRKFIISIIQLLTADNKQNTIYFINKFYKNKYTAKKSKTVNKKKYKNKKHAKEQSFYNNNNIVI